jgi:very-short-patch-repair endonuclease
MSAATAGEAMNKKPEINQGLVRLNGFLDGVFEDMAESFKNVIREIESPIEEMLCAALLSESLLQTQTVHFQGNDDGLFFGGNSPDIIRIFPQHKIGGYRVDFYLEYFELQFKTTRKLIVECDGHDFHELTKDQAQRDKSRDRILQTVAPVFRFTGSEIWKDAHDCSYQIINHLMNNQGR